MNKITHLILLLLLILTISCTQNKQTRAEITEINKIGAIAVSFNINDVGYANNSNTIYIVEEFKDYIWVYQDFNFLNKLGGKGNNRSSFQLLTDIEVAENGNLLALDNLQKRISIFDKNGIFRNSISLEKFSNPTKFTLGSDDLIYIYDKDEQEVILLNLLTSQEFMRFGKFEIDLPHAIRYGKDNLTITNPNYHTDFYNSLGGFKENHPYLTVKDNSQNTIALHNKFIFVNGQPQTPIIIESSPKGMFLKNKDLIIYTKNEVLIYNLKYSNQF